MPVLFVQKRSVPCRGVLFDKDGTLLDFMALWGKWAETLTGLLDEELSSLGARRMGDKSKLLGQRYDEGNRPAGYDKTGPLAMGTEEEITALLAWQLYAAGLPWNEALDRIRRFSSSAMAELKHRREARPLPGLTAFLEACRRAGMPLGVVTSDTTDDAITHLEWMGIRAYFGSVVGRDRVTRGKPDPEMVRLACRELGISPANSVVIGDSNADMQMGKQAGALLSIGISEEGELEGADYLLDADLIITGYGELSVQS